MIAIEQNTEKQLQRLSAMRQLYATTKVIFGWQVFLGGPVAVASAILVLSVPSTKGYVASWGLLVTLVDIFWLTPWLKRLRNYAGRIQEMFDCDVLELPWNELKAGKYPDPELIKEQSDKYSKKASRMPSNSNWYPTVVSDLPIYIGRIACQRANCWWDAKQRRRYASFIIAIVVLIFIIVFGLSLETRLTVEDFIIKVVAPLAPALVLGIRQYHEQMEVATRLDRLKDHSERLWKDIFSGKSSTEISASSRNLQDEIYENRIKSPPVFDFIFKYLRPRYEQQMNFGAEELISEAKHQLKLEKV